MRARWPRFQMMCDVPISSLKNCTTCKAFASESRGPMPNAGMTCRLHPEMWTAQYQSPCGSRGIGRGFAIDILALRRAPDASVYVQTSEAIGRGMERPRLSRLAKLSKTSSDFDLDMRGIVLDGGVPNAIGHPLRGEICAGSGSLRVTPLER